MHLRSILAGGRDDDTLGTALRRTNNWKKEFEGNIYGYIFRKAPTIPKIHVSTSTISRLLLRIRAAHVSTQRGTIRFMHASQLTFK